jgi:hypothetical protein
MNFSTRMRSSPKLDRASFAAHEAIPAFGLVVRDAHALAAASRAGFQHHRVADLGGRLDRVVGISQNARETGNGVDARFIGELLGCDLVAHRFDGARVGADKHNTRFRQRLAEPGIFGQEPVTRVHRLGAGVAAGLDDAVAQQVTLRRGRCADVDSFISHADMQRVPIGVGVDRDGLDAHFARGLQHPASDLAAVCNQDFVKHLQPLRYAYSGMLSCLRQGLSSCLSRSMASERQMRWRVACGALTSSI